MAETAPVAPKGKKDRSPSFPFIPLKVAVERLELLDKHFGRHPTPANLIGPAWGYKGLTSQADQTLAALRSYGFVTYEGVGTKRTISVSDDGRIYLRAQQENIKEAALRQAALRPRNIRRFWAEWGVDRPVDAVALDTLILNNGFGDNGARAFLRVYDETVAFAKLSPSDKADGEETAEEEIAEEAAPPAATAAPAAVSARRVGVMDGERELTTGMLSKEAGFRLIVNGQIGVKEIERLIKKLELDKEILADADEDDISDA